MNVHFVRAGLSSVYDTLETVCELKKSNAKIAWCIFNIFVHFKRPHKAIFKNVCLTERLFHEIFTKMTCVKIHIRMQNSYSWKKSFLNLASLQQLAKFPRHIYTQNCWQFCWRRVERELERMISVVTVAFPSVSDYIYTRAACQVF